MSTGTQASPPPGAKPASHTRRLLTLWIVLSIIGIIGTLIVFPIINPSGASDAGNFSYLTNTVFTALAMPVAMFVVAMVVYSVWTFREEKPLDTPVEELEDAPHLVPKNSQQIIWLVLTTVLALLTVAWGMFGFYSATTYNPPNPLVVNITGQQWLWTFNYPKSGVSSTELVLPEGRPVKLRVTSDDVLHGFVIPQLGVAMDANPGVVTTAPIVKPTRLGVFYVHCMELCGLYHTYMWSKVDVVTQATFARWIASGGHDTGGSVS